MRDGQTKEHPNEEDDERWDLGLGLLVGLGFAWAAGEGEVSRDAEERAGRPLDRLSLPR
jgi:hypothetical protein